MAKISRKALEWWLLVWMDATVAALIAWKHHDGQITPALGLAAGLVSLAMGNVAFLTGIRARNKRHSETTSRSLLFGGVSLAAIAALIMAGAIYLTPERNDYADLALSSTPLSQIHPQRTAILVKLIRRRLAISRAYEKAAAQMKPISPALYSPGSFASKSVMQEITAALTQAYDADMSDAAQQKQSMDDFRIEMGKTDPDYLKSFEASDQNDEEQRNNAADLEGKWFHSVIALYAYAGAQSREITVRKGQLYFAGGKVESEFSQQMKKSKALYDAWQTQFQQLSRGQAKARGEIGLVANR